MTTNGTIAVNSYSNQLNVTWIEKLSCDLFNRVESLKFTTENPIEFPNVKIWEPAAIQPMG